jgi:hypothetical protein
MIDIVSTKQIIKQINPALIPDLLVVGFYNFLIGLARSGLPAAGGYGQ